MDKHTPGPWVADGLTILANNGYRVCRLTEPHKNERGKERAEGNGYREANARLIAAAPDLLEALMLMLVSGAASDITATTTLMIEAITKARTAIAKAAQ